MSNYESKKDEIFNNHIGEVIEQKISRMVNNQSMEDRETNWNRGYIAACRDLGIFYNVELVKKLNEG